MIARRALLAALLVACVPGSSAAPRFVEHGTVAAESASWLSREEGRLAYGTGHEVVVRDDAGERRFELDGPTVDGLLGGGRVTLVTADRRLLSIDLRDPAAAPVPLERTPLLRREARLARLPDRLVVAESGVGLHLLALPGDHHAGHVGAVTVPWPHPITAVAADGWWLTLAGTPGELRRVDLRDLGSERRMPLPDGVDVVAAVAVLGERTFVATAEAIFVGDPAWARVDDVGAADLEPAGRTVYAAGPGGVARHRDRSASQAIFPVTVANNFYSPASLEIEIGDRVQWTNASGFHNVYACDPLQSGCAGKTAEEDFTSGAPAPALWVHSYTFQRSGQNPYVCQSHAPFMTGQVTVAEAGPPPVAALVVDKLDPAGDALEISWDAVGCPGAADTQLLWGSGTTLRAGGYVPLGARCAVGTTSPWTWNGSPATALDPGGLIWWLLVSTDGATVEGSWGLDGDGAERLGPGAGGSSGECGVSERDTSGNCPP